LEGVAEDAASQFRQLANSIPQLAWMARSDGWIYWYNERWYEYTGTTPADMAGWGWKSVHDPAALPGVIELWSASLSTGEPFEMEFPLRGADGQFRVFLTRVAPFRDSSGEIVHWFGTNTDVQYRRDAEKSLREQAATLEALNRTGTRLAAELDLDRLLQTATDAGTQLTRAQFGAFFYNTIGDEGESDTLYTLSGVPREAFERCRMPRNIDVFGPAVRGEGIIRSDDITKDPRYGTSAPYGGMPEGDLPVRSYLAAPVRSRSGEVLGGLFFGHAETGVFTEQSEDLLRGIAAQSAIAIDNARLYSQVQTLLRSEREAREEAEHGSQLKDQFLATMSHELRTPLNAVLGWAHMLDSNALSDDKRRSAIDAILRNTRIQSHLIEDLLDMSRIMTGRLRLELDVIDVRGVVEAAIDIVRPMADAKGVTVALAIEDGCCTVKGDANRLQQVVWNLLSNAIKFTPRGGHVGVHLRETATGQLELSVADNGTGIDAEFLPHVFERFRQGDGAITRGVSGLGGLGLGLSIVRSLVEMHAGEVSAHSDGAGTGARFLVTLPIATAEDTRDAPK
ncbi:MAG: GAF domain-containing protein, partial [Acidobacteria bacterium]|nr:GAF domain-containing protein [Acidobacteriota bacterium]